MIVELDPSSKEPPYAQIRATIAWAISTGELQPGARLPTIRQLAGDLDLATNTVARAYRELEADGLIRSSGRRGTVVAPARPETAARALTASEADDFVRRARERGLDAPGILALVQQALRHT